MALSRGLPASPRAAHAERVGAPRLQARGSTSGGHRFVGRLSRRSTSGRVFSPHSLVRPPARLAVRAFRRAGRACRFPDAGLLVAARAPCCAPVSQRARRCVRSGASHALRDIHDEDLRCGGGSAPFDQNRLYRMSVGSSSWSLPLLVFERARTRTPRLAVYSVRTRSGAPWSSCRQRKPWTFLKVVAAYHMEPGVERRRPTPVGPGQSEPVGVGCSNRSRVAPRSGTGLEAIGLGYRPPSRDDGGVKRAVRLPSATPDAQLGRESVSALPFKPDPSARAGRHRKKSDERPPGRGGSPFGPSGPARAWGGQVPGTCPPRHLGRLARKCERIRPAIGATHQRGEPSDGHVSVPGADGHPGRA